MVWTSTDLRSKFVYNNNFLHSQMLQNLREITIGRDKSSDIYLDESCRLASRNHAAIFYDGTQLMFRDMSTNGTMINNVRINHRTVPISNGDIIMIAGRYQISWSQINAFFPERQPKPNHTSLIDEYSRSSQLINRTKWNWGAFGLYPIWGFFNGCWWAILVSLFFGYLFPIPNIIFGVFGTRWAWENRKWNSPQEFMKTQSDWAVWGIIIFCLNIFTFLFMWIILLGLL